MKLSKRYPDSSSQKFKETNNKSLTNKLIAAALTVACTFAIIGCSESQQEQATETLGLDEEDVFSLTVGTCFNDPNGANLEQDELISDVPIRECDAPHDNEVFHIFNLTDMTEQPEATVVQDMVYTECSQAYTAFVGKDYEESAYDMSYLAPSDESWVDGDREITCYIYNPEGEQMTASMRGSSV